MRYGWIVILLLLFGMVVSIFSRTGDPHHFSENECLRCHEAPENPANIIGDVKPVLDSECIRCHEKSIENLLHPVGVSPEKSIPADMPLVNGKLGCTTCHVVHPFTLDNKKFNYYLLRRPGIGAVFCCACHGIDEKGHIVFEKIHQGEYRATERNGTLDTYSLQCLECHDQKFSEVSGVSGAGTWQHFGSSRLNHPIGISYASRVAMIPKGFNPESSLPEEVKLFNGKLGCGTCHNARSKEKYMLVTSNWKSGLCLSCHNK